ncbi:LuxR C-terminal-related transcriptional regulator [Micromonospora sp. NPDC047465]|uniref:LuxR C-terminal-related transcriptional regulator n=1 Tax=unclassified Micromonospora TaxID=2617518 RepID=UPI0033C8C81B
MRGNERMLGEVGVGDSAEKVYRSLLANPGASVTELRALTGFGQRRLRGALSELESKAMVTRRSGSPARYQSVPPDVVVEVLVRSREEALHQVRLDAKRLAALHRVPAEQERVTELIEVVTSREAYAERWKQLQLSARRSLDVFVLPPFAQQRPDDSEPLQERLLARGVPSRAIYDEEALKQPGVLEHAQRMVALGEEARVVKGLPMKLSMSDRRTALVPFVQSDPIKAVDAGLVVHECALLDALVALWDIYWERGVQLRFNGQDPSARSRTADEDTVLTLMASGMKDEAIAARLGVSAQTVRRRIAEIQRRLGVSTRFQAGVALGRQGWPVR